MSFWNRRVCAILLCFCMAVSFLPVGAHAAMVDGSDYITQQLFLNDGLTLYLRGYVDSPYAANAVATVTYADQVRTYGLEDVTITDDGQYEIGVDLAVPQMTEDIHLTITVGSLLVVDETYSVRDYLKTLIDGNYTCQTRQIAKELLNYGAWSQAYFDYHADKLANEDYETEGNYPVPAEIPAVPVSGGVDGIMLYGATTVLRYKTALRFYYKAENGVDGYTFCIDGQEVAPVSSGAYYYIEAAGIGPKNMDEAVTATVTDGTDTLSCTYTPVSYFARKYHQTTNETTKSLMAAAYSYFMTAEEFNTAEVAADMNLSLPESNGNSNTLLLTTDLPADTALADFTFLENGCSVNESANQYQTVSYVSMSKDNDVVALTLHFDGDFEAGQSYSLPKGALFCFTDNSQYVLPQDYIFSFNGTDWSMAEAEGDFLQGVGFEAVGNTLLFTGQGRGNQDGTIARVAYNTLNISVPSGGSSYALKLSHASDDPTFRICFGRELAARTRLSFMAYNTGTRSSFAISDSDVETDPLFTKTWTELSLTLPENAEYIDLCWNTGGSGGTVYLDNFLAIEPVEADNLLLGFESYEELTGAKIAVGNKLGRMEINKDIDYISQGTASLKVMPQGDYSKPGYHPYFKLDLLDTTAQFNDFSDLKNIAFDVYNPGSETLHMGVGLVTGEDYENYLTTNKQSFALAPNSWTTCYYDLSYMAGYQFYDLDNVRYMLFEFLDYKESKTDSVNVLYLDNLYANAYAQDEGPVEPTFDYVTGIDFETPGQEYLFTGQGIQNRDAEIEKITYYSTGTVSAPTDGGSYGIRLRHESNYWPTFRLHFGEEMEAGTEITFMAYGKILNGTSLYNQSVFEFSAGGDATVQFDLGKWTQLYITLPEDAEYIDLFWNYDRAGVTSANASGEVYIDNIGIVQNEPYGDILAGYGFEERGNAERFTGQGDSTNDAVIKRLTYVNLGIDAPADGGEYALKLTHSSSQTPTFRINFGQELAAGTTVTFMAYAKLNSGYVYPKKNVIQYSDGTNATDSFDFKVWKTLTVTLPEAAEYIDLTWSFKGTFGTAVCELYIDNIKATEPEVESSGDFLEGIDFETSGHEQWFGAVGGENAWRDATLEVVSFDGDNALKLTCAASQWPVFRISFGQTLKADTTITFDAYTNDTSGIRNTVSSFHYLSSPDTDIAPEYFHGAWTTLTFTLTSDCSYIDMMCNMDRWNEPGPANLEVYMDNFKATEPSEISGDITQGLDFEEEVDATYFAGQGKSQDATIERVSYADLGVAAPTDGGSYALKLSHASNYWPTFRINFGKTLKAGTTITFWAYGKINGESLYNQSIFEYSSGGEATVQFQCDAWTALTITLTADVSYIDLFWNYDRASVTSSTASGEVYLDNFKVTEPS